MGYVPHFRVTWPILKWGTSPIFEQGVEKLGSVPGFKTGYVPHFRVGHVVGWFSGWVAVGAAPFAGAAFAYQGCHLPGQVERRACQGRQRRGSGAAELPPS